MVLLGVSLVALLASPEARADYPIASHRYLADPASLVHQGRLYLYASNDDDNNGAYDMASFVCISTDDLKNWTDHGEVLRVPRDASWASMSWAPSVTERDDEIFVYFGNSGNGVGVASGTSPIGPFKDARGSVLVDSQTPGASGVTWLFDPGAFIDDDGQGYLAFGGSAEGHARIIHLGSDMASVEGSAVSVPAPDFFEASWLHKRNGIYYFSYSTSGATGTRIDYLMSSSPTSGYEYGGVALPQPPRNGNNNHAGIFEYQDKWYIAYHNRDVAQSNPGTDATHKRNLAMDELTYADDGSINTVTPTEDGLPQLKSLDPYGRVEAETIAAQSGIETEPCTDGGMDVTEIDDGDWIRVRGVNFGAAGAKTFSARVSGTKAGGSIEVRLGAMTGTLVGTCDVPSTGAAQAFMVTTCDITGASGVTDVSFVFKGSGSSLFNFDSWQFTGGDGPLGSGGMGGAGGTGGVPMVTGGTSSAAGAPASGGASAAGMGGDATAAAGASGATMTMTGGDGGIGGDATPSAGTSAGGTMMPMTNGGGMGNAGSGGNTANGGMAGSMPGAGAPTVPAAPPPGSNAGCGCRAARGKSMEGLLGLVSLLGLGVLRRRRTRAVGRAEQPSCTRR